MDLRSQVQERESAGVLGVKVLENYEPLAHCVSADCAYGAGIAVTFKDKYGVEKVKKKKKKPVNVQ